MDFSVIICTYNRATQVASLARNLLQQSVPSGHSREIIVVDNNSGDDTAAAIRAIIEESQDRVFYLFEPRQGKSHALNSGISRARGEVLIFIDDDIRPDSGFLNAYVSQFQDSSVDGAGGRILPSFETELPAWFDPDASFPFKFDFGEDACELPAPPFGANMAYRKSLFESYGLFRTDLGPSGSAGAGLGEDSEFGVRLLETGKMLIYNPKALVYHPVTGAQLSREYLLDWYRRYGRSLVARGDLTNGAVLYWGVPRYLLRKVVEEFFKWLFTFGQRRRFYNRLALVRTMGTIVQVRENWARSKSKAYNDRAEAL